MRRPLSRLLCLFGIATIGATSPDDPELPIAPGGQHWKLSYDDEFNGSQLDPKTWKVDGDYVRYGGYWLKNLASLDQQGHLVLASGQYQGKMATAGIETRGLREWQYGYFVIRAKLPLQPAGHRPAFWLKCRGANTLGNGGRDGAEIDVFEAPGRGPFVDHNVHWDMDPSRLASATDPNAAHMRATVPITYNEWHTFGVWWSPDSYRFYIDGKLSWETTAGGVSQVPESILITDEVLPRDPAAASNFAMAGHKDNFVIDYARVYQLEP